MKNRYSTTIAASLLFLAGAAASVHTGTASVQHDQTRNGPDTIHTSHHFVRASVLMNSTVRDTRGEKLGDIDELAINPETNHVVYGVLRRGGFLGIGESRHAISTGELYNDADRRVTLRIERNDIERRSGFRKNSWPLRADPRWSSGGDGAESTISASDRVVKASDIVGNQLFCSDGESAGTISDLVVELSTGRIVYAIVKTHRGGLTVPIRAIEFNGKDYTIARTSEQMRVAPAIRPDRDPDWSDERRNHRMKQGFGSHERSETIGGIPPGD